MSSVAPYELSVSFQDSCTESDSLSLEQKLFYLEDGRCD